MTTIIFILYTLALCYSQYNIGYRSGRRDGFKRAVDIYTNGGGIFSRN